MKIARQISSRVAEILTPSAARSRARSLAEDSMKFARLEMGVSHNGVPFEAYVLKNPHNNRPTTVWYGFPDPGEAVGASAIIVIMEELAQPHSKLDQLDLNWVFVPVANYDDQPENGQKHAPVMKTSKQEIDWCLDLPRPETTALVEISNRFKPLFTFPMHDEWHCHEEIPLYFPVNRMLPVNLCNEIRTSFMEMGFAIASDPQHESMGDGFFDMTVISDFKNSTFSKFSQHGLVGICEVCDLKTLSPAGLAAAQIFYGLKLLDWALDS